MAMTNFEGMDPDKIREELRDQQRRAMLTAAKLLDTELPLLSWRIETVSAWWWFDDKTLGEHHTIVDVVGIDAWLHGSDPQFDQNRYEQFMKWANYLGVEPEFDPATPKYNWAEGKILTVFLSVPVRISVRLGPDFRPPEPPGADS